VELTPWMSVLAVGVALWVDRAWGEPPLRWHPVVWIGQYLTWTGARIAPVPTRTGSADSAVACDWASPADWGAFGLGAMAWIGGAAFFASLAWGLQSSVLEAASSDAQTRDALTVATHVLVAVVLGVMLKPLLAWRMLEQEVQAVEAALRLSLDQGRERLSWICSRDTRDLTEVQVRETAIESLAENLNDSVIAPVFWFVCLGLPGAVLYRFANTADAMWGYRGERDGRVWEWAGKWAARADDVLSWVPARLTAGLLMVTSVATRRTPWTNLWREARQTPSPNSGWPMAAMALSLHVRLGKPGVYVLNASGESAQATDVDHACAQSTRAVKAGVLALWVWALLVQGAGAWHG